jgi:NADP-dependent 3-hydroxy acid dehydrogenase YdfG
VVDIADDEWDQAVRESTSTFYACCAVGHHFLERKRGSVINVGSTAGMRGRPCRRVLGEQGSSHHFTRSLWNGHRTCE